MISKFPALQQAIIELEQFLGQTMVVHVHLHLKLQGHINLTKQWMQQKCTR